MRPKTISDSDLLKIACQCFIENGPSVSTTLIAQAAGVSQATLFKRFKNKEQLMAMALTHEAPVLLQKIESPATDRAIRDQLHEMCSFMVAIFRVVVPRFMCLAASGSNTPSQIFGGEHGPPALTRKKLTEWLKQAQAQGQLGAFDPDSFAVGLIGMMQTRTFREVALGDLTLNRSDEEYVTAIIDLLWSGIAPKENS